MNDLINFLKTRRSVLIKNLSNDDILESDLKDILECGLRVPDHGILSPWKIKVIKGKSRKTLGNEVLAKEYFKLYPNSTKEMIQFEKNRFMRAGVILAVISSAISHPKIPKWEMYLSCGALCQNLLNASIALGYGAQWVTEWYSYNKKLLQTLGGNSESEKFAGFIYIGKMLEKPVERKRADLDQIVTNIKL